ncbi:glycoside hydrolase superfamily [Amylocarpus encephaloides]|uniref:Alpha-amylase n=1 Tax=Amylocarpus encephaloides TaxID=45428 RepID=A0A9P7YGX8_9HELO|nr:glycoside hydrolase superfamily [Amylocarpus encephaloides]
MASFRLSRLIQQVSIALFAFLLLAIASPLEKRATQVALIGYTFQNNFLSGSINIQNIAYAKVVTVIYSVGNSWTSSQNIAASYSVSGSNGYETWTFSGTAAGATQFFIKYDVSGISYYDPGNSVNYQISSATSGATLGTSTSTSTTSTIPIPTTTSAETATGTSGPVSASIPPPIVPTSIPGESPATSPSGCGNWNGGDSCPSDSTSSFTSSAENRRWQTPPNGGPGYDPSFGTYRDLVGYADIQYNSARTSAVVVINAASRTGETITYSFNGGIATTSNTFQVAQSFSTALPITISTSSGKILTLDPINFIWQNKPLTAAQSTFQNGQKGGIVELFGWPWVDVGKECAFLGKAGYMGVKIWPPNEHIWGSNYYETDNQFRPWYLVYQPVSYRLHSRSGTREELRNMIQACRTAGVRVYADTVVNHMAAQGTDVQNHRNSDCSLYSGHNATAGSPYFTSGNTYLLSPQTGTRPTMEYPAVPFGPTDFHCERSISSWTDMNQVTKGYLVGLTDLNTEKPYTQDRIASYIVDLLSIGFTGLRFDAAKHIGPSSIAAIFAIVKRKMGGSMPADYISWLEVILGGEASVLACDGGADSWYTNFNNILSRQGFTAGEISQVKIWSSDYPKEMPICGSWVIPPSRFAIQNDDHDQQNPGSSSRDMQSFGSVLIKDKDVAKHRAFEVQLFSRTDADWWIKLVLSSYMFMDAGGAGFPDGLSDCGLYTGSSPASACLGVPKDAAFVEGSCGYTMQQGKYTRVHRDLSIINAMRGWVGLGSTTASSLGIGGCA